MVSRRIKSWWTYYNENNKTEHIMTTKNVFVLLEQLQDVVCSRVRTNDFLE